MRSRFLLLPPPLASVSKIKARSDAVARCRGWRLNLVPKAEDAVRQRRADRATKPIAKVPANMANGATPRRNKRSLPGRVNNHGNGHGGDRYANKRMMLD
ncbi:hypothetical protein SAE02_33870 [Skermanella aerolata]|uniref:Uncharacterized protein n=1 Tax=Skermanella aerolata TaxID=393310 RepID=A0A512DRY1_9PROT|nr:hypothetical protein SAE02_33870 [Skermanella aerolata]